ncbi:hypothetical protein DY000_02002853 [Brassica cretica]|uniref:Uncharacterized protein n=1 Tax=Brassica cretica TaxID=69181 RepID=A0ABQ7C3Y5_BRACR|nr:hypothetical protein DY000_02002853 [Brassica cretica]
MPLILGRAFLATVEAVVEMPKGKNFFANIDENVFYKILPQKRVLDGDIGIKSHNSGKRCEPEHYKKTARILREKIVGISSEYRYSDDIPTKQVVGNNSSEFLLSSEIPRNFPTEFRGTKFPRKPNFVFPRNFLGNSSGYSEDFIFRRNVRQNIAVFL